MLCLHPLTHRCCRILISLFYVLIPYAVTTTLLLAASNLCIALFTLGYVESTSNLQHSSLVRLSTILASPLNVQQFLTGVLRSDLFNTLGQLSCFARLHMCYQLFSWERYGRVCMIDMHVKALACVCRYRSLHTCATFTHTKKCACYAFERACVSLC